jgi:DNA-binding CsgD family transcriptional regulator
METASALAFREWVLRELRDHFDCGSAIFVDECKGGCTTGGQPGALAVGSRLDARVAARGVHLASLTMFRHPGAPPFDDEDRRALSEVLPALTAIFSAHKHLDSSEPTASRVAPALGPRLRQTLALLLSGMSEKEVAAAMALSPHTVHQYVKKLYRAHRVRSRPELLAALLSR